METINPSLAAIVPSPTNPRKHFDQVKLEELAASIRSQGLLQPILVRPGKNYRVVPGKQSGKEGYFIERSDSTGKPVTLVSFHETEKDAKAALPKWELVAGERRWRAAAIAELKVIPAIERELSDLEVRIIQTIENEQREDVTPLERAQGYQNLLDAKMPLEAVAVKVGKSVSTLRGFLRLLQLPERAQKALAAGELNPSVAQALARIPAGKCREEAIQFALKANFYGERPSYRSVKDHIERDCMVELKDAPFDRKALDLVPAAGTCDQCPKRAGNIAKEEPESVKGLRADICTDPECYRAKARAHIERQTKAHTDKGERVLSEKEAAKIFYDNGTLQLDCAYVDLDRDCWRAANGKAPPKYRQLIGKMLEPGDVVRAFDPQGHEHELISSSLADRLLDQKGIRKGNTRSGAAAGSPAYKKELAQKRKLAAEQRAVEEHLLYQAREFGQAAAKQDKKAAGKLQALLQLLALEELRAIGSAGRESIYRVYAAQGQTNEAKFQWLEGQIQELPTEDLLVLLARLLTALYLQHYIGESKRRLICSKLELDVAKAREAARAAAKQAAAAKKPAAKKRKEAASA